MFLLLSWYVLASDQLERRTCRYGRRDGGDSGAVAAIAVVREREGGGEHGAAAVATDDR